MGYLPLTFVPTENGSQRKRGLRKPPTPNAPTLFAQRRHASHPLLPVVPYFKNERGWVEQKHGEEKGEGLLCLMLQTPLPFQSKVKEKRQIMGRHKQGPAGKLQPEATASTCLVNRPVLMEVDLKEKCSNVTFKI